MINKVVGFSDFDTSIKRQDFQASENKKVKFSDFLKKAIYDANDARMYERELTEKLISGQLENMHELSVARSVANVKFQALTEGVSKIAEAYKEISRIQI